MKKTKVLFLAANPVDTNHLILDEELRRIREQLRDSSINNTVELVDVQAARPDDWLKALNAQHFRMVHFSGHGTKGGALQHVGSDGTAQLVSFQALKATLHVLKGEICLVILNACYSRQQAALIAEEIDCVIAMNDAIHDEVATIFSNAFYRAFFSGKSVQNAFEQGQVALMMEGLTGAHIPELLVRPGIDTSKVMLIEPSHPNKAFIAYSPEDKRFLDELHTRLGHYVHEGLIDYWDDTKLEAGSKWQQETRQALASARVAILLISASFFASPSIKQDQLPFLLQAAERGEIKIFCVLLRAFDLADTNLKQFTLVNSQPLNGLSQSKRDEVWHNLVRVVRDNLQNDI